MPQYTTDYKVMSILLINSSLYPPVPLIDDTDFSDLMKYVRSLEAYLATVGYDVLYTDKEKPALLAAINSSMAQIVACCVKYLSDKVRKSKPSVNPPTEAILDTTEQDLITNLVEVIKDKNTNYGESWCQRGGQGAFFSYVRKTDRLNSLIPKYLAGTLDVCQDDSFDDTFFDIIGYLGLFLERRVSIMNNEAFLQG